MWLSCDHRRWTDALQLYLIFDWLILSTRWSKVNGREPADRETVRTCVLPHSKQWRSPPSSPDHVVTHRDVVLCSVHLGHHHVLIRRQLTHREEPKTRLRQGREDGQRCVHWHSVCWLSDVRWRRTAADVNVEDEVLHSRVNSCPLETFLPVYPSANLDGNRMI